MKYSNRLFLLFGIALWTGSVQAQSNGSLQSAVSLDLLGQFGEPFESQGGKVEPREAEIILFAPVDSLWDGFLNLAAHQEQGQAYFEIHEAYLSSSRWLPHSQVRIGQYFLQVGRLNQFHRHDWPFISAPMVQRSFFDNEGANDSGVEWSFLFPTDHYLNLTIGITSGWRFGHSHSLGEKPNVPTTYARLSSYSDLWSNGGTQYGLNTLIREDASGNQTTLLGADLTAKWRSGRTLDWLIQGEIWAKSFSTPSSSEWSLGSYLFTQYGVSQQVHLGLRLESLGNLSLKDAFGTPLANTEYAIVPTLTYKYSEFSTFRAAYSMVFERDPGEKFQPRQFLELQSTFIIGAHPAHDF